MRIPLIAALAAATALVPAAASAQSRHDNGGWHRSTGGGHADHAQRSAPRGHAMAPRQARNDRPASDRTWRGNAGQHNRGDDSGRARPQFERPSSGSWHAEAGGQDHRGWRGDRDRDRGNGNWQQRRDDRDGWNRSNQDWRDHRRDAHRSDRRAAFNRDWRRDRRYDWRDYRSRNRSAYRLPRYYAPHGWHYGYRRFGIGLTLDSVLFGSNYWISDPWAYRLPPAYGPYRWVRYYDDALLVDIRTGYVVDVVYDIFW